VSCFAEREQSILRVKEMVERPEEQYGVERRVVERKRASVSNLSVEQRWFSGRDASTLNVTRHRVEHSDLMADPSEPGGVVARATTNVENCEGTCG